MNIFSVIVDLAKTAGAWALKNPETVMLAADKAKEMHDNAKDRKQEKEEYEYREKAAVVSEELSQKMETLGQIQLEIASGLTSTQQAVDSVNAELFKTKETVAALSIAVEEMQSKYNTLAAKYRRDRLLYTIGLGACLVIAIVISIVV